MSAQAESEITHQANASPLVLPPSLHFGEVTGIDLD